ncbi:MAG: aminotransferase class V-fold PLP-dependent enzyme [Candidatus Nanopelagicales bacterium]|nr:aminotransferase class V-fold PLP-dependent enzyme [Candidatus Nanopelagicales bacterium]
MAGFDEFIDGFYPYRRETQSYKSVPEEPRPRAEVLAEIAGMAGREDAMGDEGRVSGSLYSGDHEHYEYLGEVFTLFSHANVLQRDMYPSATKFEAEIVAMALDLVHGSSAGGDACGVVTGGGSESLITALYSYREVARERGVTKPNLVMPNTAHVALDKGAYWMDIEVRHSPVGDDCRADVDAMADMVDDQTIAVVGSAGNYPYGVIDPIPEIADLAASKGIGMHVDGCLGGFVWPWAEELGYPVPLWDFRVPGVTSISADTHKYGYGLKGTSTLMYRTKDLRRHQYFTHATWPGGLYLSPGLAGSRSGGLIAATWAAMVTTGRTGYLSAAKAILETAATIRAGVEATDGVALMGDSLFVAAFRADEEGLDIYLVNDALKRDGWRLNSLQLPAALHFCVTRPNTKPGVAQEFVASLGRAVDYAREHADTPAESGAMYGFGATPQGRQTMMQLMSGVLDAMHEVAPAVEES